MANLRRLSLDGVLFEIDEESYDAYCKGMSDELRHLDITFLGHALRTLEEQSFVSASDHDIDLERAARDNAQMLARAPASRLRRARTSRLSPLLVRPVFH